MPIKWVKVVILNKEKNNMQIGLVERPPSRLELKQIKYSEYVKSKEVNNETDIMKYDAWLYSDTYWKHNEGTKTNPLYGFNPIMETPIQIRELEKQVPNLIEKYYKGDITKDEIKDFIKEAYEVVKKVNKESFLTSGLDKKDNMQMLDTVVYSFKLYSAEYTVNKNFEEGKGISGGKDSSHWDYYNANYYYKDKEMGEFLLSVGIEIAKEEDLGDFTEALQPPNDDFFRTNFNTHTDCPLSDASIEPPKGFVYYQDHRSTLINISGVAFDSKDLNISESKLSSIPDSYKRFLANIKRVLPSFIEQLMKSVKDDAPNLYQSNKAQSAYDAYLNYKYF